MGRVQTHGAIKRKHGSSLFDVFRSKSQTAATAANLRPPRKLSCVTKEKNIQVGPQRRVLGRNTPKQKVRKAAGPETWKESLCKVCVYVPACPCMHICHTHRLRARINKRIPCHVTVATGHHRSSLHDFTVRAATKKSDNG